MSDLDHPRFHEGVAVAVPAYGFVDTGRFEGFDGDLLGVHVPDLSRTLAARLYPGLEVQMAWTTGSGASLLRADFVSFADQGSRLLWIERTQLVVAQRRRYVRAATGGTARISVTTEDGVLLTGHGQVGDLSERGLRAELDDLDEDLAAELSPSRRVRAHVQVGRLDIEVEGTVVRAHTPSGRRTVAGISFEIDEHEADALRREVMRAQIKHRRLV